MSKPALGPFKFRKHETVGAIGAEEDQEFLADCFIDTGDLAALRDSSTPYRIVLGRTGSGKTALLLRLRNTEEHVAWLEPDQLALQYVSNSSILRQLEQMGVDLDIFYRLLWRHVFAVELVRLKYNLRSLADQQSFLSKITAKFFGDKRKTGAFEYLRSWGEQFWKDTEYRIHEVTTKVENDIKASLGGKAALLTGELEAGHNTSVEDKKEIVHRAQEVVNAVQIHELAKVIDVLAEEEFADPLQRYFVVIDRLDEKWVDDKLRYRLIRALLETVKAFQKIENTKIVVALRHDLLERVFRETRDEGFQEEKYRPLFLNLQWSESQLLDGIDRRLNKVVQRQYTKEAIGWGDLFPPSIDGEPSFKYVVSRTMYRPRDLIEFVNCCVGLAVGRSSVTIANVRDAEAEYSAFRFRSLGDEWISDFPDLLSFAGVLKRKPAQFGVAELPLSEIEELSIAVVRPESEMTGPLRRWVMELFNEKLTAREFRLRLAKVFYRVGLVGIRPARGVATSWVFRDRGVLREAEITEEARLEICPMFYRVLGIDPRR